LKEKEQRDKIEAERIEREATLGVYDARSRPRNKDFVFPEARQPMLISYVVVSLDGLDALAIGGARLGKIVGGGETMRTLEARIDLKHYVDKEAGRIAFPVDIFDSTDDDTNHLQAKQFEYGLERVEGTAIGNRKGTHGDRSYQAGQTLFPKSFNERAKAAGTDPHYVEQLTRDLTTFLDMGEDRLQAYVNNFIRNDHYFCPVQGCSYSNNGIFRGFVRLIGFQAHHKAVHARELFKFVCPNGQDCV